MKKHLLLCFLFVLAFSGCTDNDDRYQNPETTAIVGRDNELYALLKRVVETDDENPVENISCIRFVYPLQLTVYDLQRQPIGTVYITGDEMFSGLLENLPADYLLNISYPIVTLLANGEAFSVNNNEELKLAINACSQPEIISYCNGIICGNPQQPEVNCPWFVKYHPSADNTYVGGLFSFEPGGQVVFHFDDADYAGSWAFHFINSELHLNINLEGSSQIATDWNIDRRVSLLNGQIVIEDERIRILRKACEETAEYEIGQTGPQSGLVFYDKGSYSSGWRYMEVFAGNFDWLEWGCMGSPVEQAQHAAIGRGLYNSAAIVNFHDAFEDYYGNPSVCNPLNNGTVAADQTLSTALGDKGWFLPSQEELLLVYNHLHLAGLGSFGGIYWTSTQADAGHAQTIDFDTGNIAPVAKIPGIPVKTLAVRYF